MGLSNSILAYEKETALLEQALNSVKGIIVRYNSDREAIHAVHRFNKFRSLDRLRNRQIYAEPAHQMHGASVYDRLQITREAGVVTIKILPQTEKLATIEEIQ